MSTQPTQREDDEMTNPDDRWVKVADGWPPLTEAEDAARRHNDEHWAARRADADERVIEDARRLIESIDRLGGWQAVHSNDRLYHAIEPAVSCLAVAVYESNRVRSNSLYYGSGYHGPLPADEELMATWRQEENDGQAQR